MTRPTAIRLDPAGSLGSPDAQSDMVALMVGYGFMAVVLGVGVYLFFTSAQKARRVLRTGA
jgi:hypothetical protein